jgi:hypothetical protein
LDTADKKNDNKEKEEALSILNNRKQGIEGKKSGASK